MRYPAIDWLRAVSILYIVGFWHLFSYVKGGIQHKNTITYILVVLALGIFVFVSGYLVGKAASNDAIRFYKRRFWRIYPPFVIASLLFLLVGIGDPAAILRGIVGLGVLISPAPKTLWFISMILMFYLVAPLLHAVSDHFVRYLISVSGIIVFLLGYRASTGIMDDRILIYFPAFAAGIIVGRRDWLISNLHIAAVSGLAVASLFLLHDRQGIEFNLWSMPWAMFGSAAVFSIVLRVLDNGRLPSVVFFISSASFLMYALHRVIIDVMMRIYFPQSVAGKYLYLLLLVVPVVLIISWLSQKIYNRLLSRYISPGRVEVVA